LYNAKNIRNNYHFHDEINVQKDREINGKGKCTISESESHRVADSFSKRQRDKWKRKMHNQ
jgi:hypothetical protein